MNEQINKIIMDWIGEDVKKATGINAIPETNEYANGWNDCRKEAFELKSLLLQSLRSRTPELVEKIISIITK